MNSVNFSNHLKIAIKSSIEAGLNIMKIYSKNNIEIECKEDLSPITKADKISNKIIFKNLKKTKINILSEEGIDVPYRLRKNWPLFWLIDPLDGTKEFLKKNGEFTVNIALVNNNKPVIGVIYAPAFKKLYFSEKGIGSFRVDNISDFKYLETCKIFDLSEVNYPKTFTCVTSRSHSNKKTLTWLNNQKKIHNKLDSVCFGSSIKMCKVADGSAHVYPRFGPTYEWDTAAAQAIIENSGGSLVNYRTKKPLIYNKESLLNPSFIATYTNNNNSTY